MKLKKICWHYPAIYSIHNVTQYPKVRLASSHQQSTQNTFGPTPCAHNAISALRTPSKLYEFFVWFSTCCAITLVFVCCFFFFYTGVLVFSSMDLLLWDITWSARLISREPFSFHQNTNSPFFLFTFLPFVYFSFLIQLRNTTPFLCTFIIAQENKIKNKQTNNMSTPSLSSTGESGLPEGWEIRQSRSRNLPYYFCPATTESSWEPPAGTDSVKLKAFMAKYHTVSPGAAPGSTSAATAGEQIRASHLLIKHRESRRPSSWKESTITRTKPEALELIRGYQQQIASGERTLAEIAARESDCSSARKAGDLGFFKRGDMQKEFETAAFALDVGQVSDVVESASGYHLIQRTA